MASFIQYSVPMATIIIQYDVACHVEACRDLYETGFHKMFLHNSYPPYPGSGPPTGFLPMEI